MSLSPARTRALLRAMRGRRVLVLGDVMLDQFLWGKVARISPEAPVPVVEVASRDLPPRRSGQRGRQRARPRRRGGGGRSGRRRRGGRARALGAGRGRHRGRAERGRRRPADHGEDAHHRAPSAGGARGPRVLGAASRARSSGRCSTASARALPSCGAVILSDYQKGVVTAAVMKSVTALARRRGVPVLVDPKVAHFALYRRVALVTPNQAEAEQATGVRIRSAADVLAAGESDPAAPALRRRPHHARRAGHVACSSRGGGRCTSPPPRARSST